MTLGMGIFLAALVLGFIYLYSVTKDRWRWGTWFKRLIFAVVILSVLGTASYFGFNYFNNRPKPFTTFDGISLGDSQDDVKFKKGIPQVICTESSDPNWILWGWDFTAVTFEKPYGAWTIFTPDITLNIDGKPFKYPELGDVTQFDSLEYINGRYGPPSRIEPADNGLRRTFMYRKYNLKVQFAQDKVKWYGIYNVNQKDDARFPPGSKRECHLTETNNTSDTPAK